MQQKIKLTIISLTVLLASFVLLLCFVVLKDNKTSSSPLTLTSSNITMLVGTSKTDFYEVSNENAIIEISAENEELFKIENNVITAIKAGQTKITIIASLNGDKAKTTFLLTAENETYTHEITAISNCYFENSILYLTDNACQFSVTIFDKIGNVFHPEIINPSANNGAIIQREMTSFLLVSNSGCVITIEYPEINLNFVIIATKA